MNENAAFAGVCKVKPLIFSAPDSCDPASGSHTSARDDVLMAIKKLSSQIEALRLAMDQGPASSNAATAIDEREKKSPWGYNAIEATSEHPGEPVARLNPAAKPPLPDPRLIRRIIRQRHLRDQFFKSELFSDPVWNMLLDLAAATSEYRQVSVTSLCMASRVPLSTALRWIGAMVEEGLVRRVEDPQDRRRAFILLTDSAVSAMARYFEFLGADAKLLM